MVYSRELDGYVQAVDKASGERSISGSELRELLKRGERPADWMIRPEISQLILDGIAAGEQVVVGE